MEYISMDESITTSLSVPAKIHKELRKIQKNKFLDTGAKLSLGEIAIIYLEKWLIDGKFIQTTRSRATGYNREANDFQIVCVNWSVRDYNILRARVQMIKMSLSYVFFMAFRAYGENLLFESQLAEMVSEISLGNSANYYFFPGTPARNETNFSEKIIYLQRDAYPPPSYS